MTKYSPSSIEKKWSEVWNRERIYQPDLKKAAKPFYNLMMFPYPSAEGLHVGNMYAFAGTDVFGRFKRMKGFDVFEPIGLDGFGIHSENYAIKKGEHPAEMAKKTESHFYEQLRLIGNGFAWDNKIETYDPAYYKWTQWIFVKLFKAGLAYRKNAKVNYCPSCKTVLADEQVVKKEQRAKSKEQVVRGSSPITQGTVERGLDPLKEVEVNICERCSTVVEKRDLEQWFFRITAYADRLLSNIEKLDWSEKVKVAQRHWIGKKQGAFINFSIVNCQLSIKTVSVFTTRPDTIFGATFVVLSPDHSLSKEIAFENREVAIYLEKHNHNAAPQGLTFLKGEKTGVFTGHYVANPVNNRLLPIWISDYVLLEYGTGAIMGVPGHDLRDFEFAKKYLLPILRVVKGPKGEKGEIEKSADVWEGAGTIINSNFLDNLNTKEAQKAIIEFLQNATLGRFASTYHLRDWIISSQRYWGPPIPMIYCEKCAAHGKSWFDSDEAAVINFKSQILNSKQEQNSQPKAGQPSAENDQNGLGFSASDLEFPWDREITRRWLPVSSYIGGAEHSVLHLLYSRFIWKALRDMGYIDFSAKGGPASGWEEPFTKFRAHGLLIRDGGKMSKSKGNVINPDDYITKFGADTLRTYLMFLGPFDQGGDFRDTGIAGIYRFLGRVWTLVTQSLEGSTFSSDSNKVTPSERSPGGAREGVTLEGKMLLKELSRVIKKVGEDIENLRFNTAIASLMEFLNFWQKNKESADREVLSSYIKLLAPFAPFMTEELWQKVTPSERSPGGAGEGVTFKGNFHSIHLESWPTYKEEDLVEDRVTFIIQVNGKVRGRLELSPDAANKHDLVETMGKALPGVYKFLEGKTIKNVIFVPGKLINFVV